MSADDFEQPVAASGYGRQRRAAWLAGLQANADTMTEASMAAHRADHSEITRSTHGIFGALTGEQLAASVAARQAVVGSAYGGRPLERLGGTFDHAATGPAPARVDLRFVDRPQPTGESPLLRYMRGRDQ